MKVLVVTQAVDERHAELGFFIEWIKGFASRHERVEVICLFEGAHALPNNVRVHSLGKERGKRSKFWYALTFLSLAWKLRRDYDSAFVHMNEEYVLLAGLLWKVLGTRVYLWRNHGSGSWRTRVAGWLSQKVFATSSRSYVASFNNFERMPVGVDLSRFAGSRASRVPGSVLMVGRIAPTKNVRRVADALANLARSGTHLPFTLVGDTQEKHRAYHAQLMQVLDVAGVGLSVRGVVPHQELPRVYGEHDIVVNVSEAGMFDKTMLEALASGCLLLTSHEDLAPELDPRERTDGMPADIAEKLTVLAALSSEEREALVERGRRVAAAHDLNVLMARLGEAMYA